MTDPTRPKQGQESSAEPAGQQLLAELEAELTPDQAEPSKLEDFLGVGETPHASAPAVVAAGTGLRSARVLSVAGKVAQVRLRGAANGVAARLAPEVDQRLIQLAVTNRDHVLVELEGSEVWVVGVLQVRIPDKLELRAREIVVEAEQELTMRSGRAAARFRKDGDIEIVGSRISAASRGLFRIVGRLLRLN